MMPVEKAGETELPLIDTEGERREALVRQVFSEFTRDQLGGFSIDELIDLAGRMHRTLMSLQPGTQRLPNVFTAIEIELGDRMAILDRQLPEFGNSSPFGILVRFAKDEFNVPIFDASANNDDE